MRAHALSDAPAYRSFPLFALTVFPIHCHAGHYTGHFKSVVTKHQNVFVMKDIMANGYRAGSNTKFFGKTLQEIREGLMTRLNMDDTTGDAILPSMLAFPMSKQQYEDGQMDTAMSVTSRYLPYEVASAAHKSFPGGENWFKFYDEKIGLRAVHFGEDLRASENMEYMSQVSLLTRIVYTCVILYDFDLTALPLSFVAHRARPTTRSASSARTASTTRWCRMRATQRSSRAWATGAPTRALAM
jgi:hypothetical protein